MIMNIVDKLFDVSSELAPDWTNYIDSLIQEIAKPNAYPMKAKGRKTERNKSKHINNNGRRTTKRNNT